jgi:hypothetical protein
MAFKPITNQLQATSPHVERSQAQYTSRQIVEEEKLPLLCITMTTLSA